MKKRQAGFSLVEMMVVVAILTIVSGTIFEQINAAMRNSKAEATKLDLFQESREFLDQMSRDLRGAGFPNTRNFQPDPDDQRFKYSSQYNAVGVVKLDRGDLWFEGALDGSQYVSVIHYHLDLEGLGCPCLRRSQTQKVEGDPLTSGATNYMTQVQHVDTTEPVFTAYYTDGTVVPLPIDISNPQIANINSIAVKLTVRSPYADMGNTKSSVTMMSTIKLNNCSQAMVPLDKSVMGC